MIFINLSLNKERFALNMGSFDVKLNFTLIDVQYGA